MSPLFSKITCVKAASTVNKSYTVTPLAHYNTVQVTPGVFCKHI